MSSDAFDRYAPFIREHIYRKRWADLRTVQAESCDVILDTDQHLIIASATASGKTEAAFFPVLTDLERNAPESIGVMYIGPIKALINDQFERLSDLLAASDIPVWAWHGDVSHSSKARALKCNRGILQITPESLEALLIKRCGEVRRLFRDLRYVVIDEMHALMGTDRGLQLLCLLARMERIAGGRPRRIGISATLNDYEPAKRFISSGDARGVAVVGIEGKKRMISLGVECFLLPQDAAESNEAVRRSDEFVYQASRGKKCIIFTNGRARAEEIVARMKVIAGERGEPDIFHTHHGSVSALLRTETESALRAPDRPLVASATTTLEMGIDIGDLDLTIQLGAAPSCASFVQRLGRSGRRTGKSRMLFVNREREQTDGPPHRNLPWELLRTISVIQLYMEEKWVEPFELKPKPFSLLVQQTLSLLASEGEMKPPELARKALSLQPFRDGISLDEYRDLLRHMLACDYLLRLETGSLIIGNEGERLINRHSFYAVFAGSETYRVISHGGDVGTLDGCPALNEEFTLAGRVWKVTAVDESRCLIFVEQASGGESAAAFSGVSGSVHTRIIERMRQVLAQDIKYPYLLTNALTILNEARDLARESSILERAVVPCGERSLYIYPWVGTKALRTMKHLLAGCLREPLKITRVSAGRYHLGVATELAADEFVDILCQTAIAVDDPDIIPADFTVPKVDKYDSLIPEPLLRRAYLSNELDVPAAVRTLKDLSAIEASEELQ